MKLMFSLLLIPLGYRSHDSDNKQYIICIAFKCKCTFDVIGDDHRGQQRYNKVSAVDTVYYYRYRDRKGEELHKL